jgi:anti-anti-sigma factor
VTFDIERGPNWALLRLSGQIDIAWMGAHQDALSEFFENCPALVVVDLDPVKFMDSTGLAFLAKCVKSCHTNDGKVTVVSPSEAVRKSIEIVGLDQYLTIVDMSAEQFTHDLPTDKDFGDPVMESA